MFDSVDQIRINYNGIFAKLFLRYFLIAQSDF